MSEQSEDKNKWNSRYATSAENFAAAEVLISNTHLLPENGKALDLACGLGANALLLAEKGLKTCAWDISDVAIDRLQAVIKARELALETEVRDVIQNPPAKHSFDVIVVSRFLDRNTLPSLIEALNPGGLIFYQTFVIDKRNDVGPSNPDYLLKPNELLQLFRSLMIRVYREEGLAGNLTQGFRNEAMLVAQKP